MPQVTSQAPEFRAQAVVDGQIKEIGLNDYDGKWKILFFYPLDFTFVCPTEIIAFSERAKDFTDANAQLIGVSVDSHFTHLAWVNTARKDGGLGGINFPLVADLDKSIARDYGVLLDAGIALRGLFLIDPSGVIRHSTINDLPVGRNVDEALRVLEAFQFTDEHGEVCPANWVKGADTMKPDPEGSKEYFSKLD
ncbi:MAG: peroxiredoxin [Candidatus Cloacimonetes bacterium]|nr:peroxiredoxin [Candidatus Cloacimonadota bacterium]